MALVQQSSFSSWYTVSSPSTFVGEIYENAVTYFETELTDDNNTSWLRQHHTVEEVFEAVQKVRENYINSTSSGVGQSVLRWITTFSAQIMSYRQALDSLTQPFDYASVIWGVTKFILKGVLNHAELVVEFTKGMAEIGDVLSRIDLSSRLYPIDRVKRVVVQIYGQVMLFLKKAAKWYVSSPARKLLSSVVKPWSLKYQDTLERIRCLAASIDAMASNAARAEMRDFFTASQRSNAEMGEKLEAVLSIANQHEQHMREILATTTSTRLLNESMSIKLDNQTMRMLDVQLAQLLLKLRPKRMPEDVLYSCQAIAKRRQLWAHQTSDLRQFIENLDQWATDSASCLFVLRAQKRAENRTKDLAVEVVKLLQNSCHPTFWYFSDTTAENEAITIAHVLRSLIYQVVSRHQLLTNETSELSNILRSENTFSELELADLLVSLLSRIPPCFIIIEMQTIFQRMDRDEEWQVRAERLFQDAVDAVANRDGKVKILLVSYLQASNDMREQAPRRMSDVVYATRIPIQRARKSLVQSRRKMNRMARNWQ